MDYYRDEVGAVTTTPVTVRMPVPLRDRLQALGEAWGRRRGADVSLTAVVLRLLDVAALAAEAEFEAIEGVGRKSPGQRPPRR